MRLIAYPTSATQPEIRAATRERDWMEALPDQFGYRCLPLVIANCHGWEILCPAGFEATWNGGTGKDDISIRRLDAGDLLPTTHFGSGILTFHTGYLFQTEPGHNLWVQGPTNALKDAIQPLTGVIETDWSPYTFTMNWKFTRSGQAVRFEKGEPFCFLFPLSRDLIDGTEPEIRNLDDSPELRDRYRAWTESRNSFNTGLLEPGSEAQKAKWQKIYFQGDHPDGATGAIDHKTKLTPREFADKRPDGDGD